MLARRQPTALLLRSNTPKPRKTPKSPSTPKLRPASLNPQPPSIRSWLCLRLLRLHRRVLRPSRSLAPSALLSPSLGVLSVNLSENPSRRRSPFAVVEAILNQRTLANS
ncbi:hypothetical protein PIB30_067644 [Stylosanthes scabra]|uniref:Uncharacterized protein n=1 Tax=Stylosanthes scabra TaxID=79078 RepID=A0ABU6ZLF3_9FABA|nr:hypothetical protein [Stylosanthes scabra]